MYLTKIVVLVAHTGDLDVDDLASTIDAGIAQQLEADRTQLTYEVRPDGTREVTLASISGALEEGHPLQEATDSREPVSTGR